MMMMMITRDDIVFAQTPLLKSQLEELKRLTGAKATKDALMAVILHYLECPAIRGAKKKEDEWWFPAEKNINIKIKKRKGGEKYE